MIYLVTSQQQLFDNELYSIITVKESLQEMETWKVIQLDSETTGRDSHLCDFLCVQFGNDKADKRIVVDCTTIDIKEYKNLLESKLCILQNAKFDLQFFFNYGIIIRKVYDTMIVEQLLHLGWPAGQISYALNAIADRRLGINIDKTVRGEIIWRGLDSSVIQYAAGDVTYLEQIMHSQLEDLRNQDLMKAAKIECAFVPAIAYLEWCGIHLDREKWLTKMKADQEKLTHAEEELNKFVVNHPSLQQFTYVDTQGDLFSGYNLEPKININWASSQQVVKVAKLLGFNTAIKDKKTGEDKDSVLEKHLKSQKGICD